ncbi:hypothetical protein [Streptomyces goshikiensis]|uniref:hypothetical protein n=1 Tax=Streptomyces goshikiensis TaxID=1942 RepID=UPI003698BC71
MTRREWLLAAIQREPGPVTTHRAEQLLTDSPFSHHRNSARKSLRSLTRDGALVAVDASGRRAYRPTPTEHLINTERRAS